jgi:hypothetical protein
MPYAPNSGKWIHLGGSCSQCDGTGFILTDESLDENKGLSKAVYAWRCNCHIGMDRNLRFPPRMSQSEHGE